MSTTSGKDQTMLTLTIDGERVQAQAGQTVLEAALSHDIDIPRLCYHPELSVSGGCRLCMVEVEGRPAPIPSCGLAAENGQIIRTQTPALTALRREIIDLFVADHPLNCAACDKNGACDLQKYAYEFGLSATTHAFELSRTLYQDDNPFFIRDHQMCILCGRCVRVCDEVIGAHAIDFVGRGFTSHIGTPFDAPLKETSCVFCGSCVQVCPTAALLPVARLHKGREWELEHKRTICGYCGVGCGIEYRTRLHHGKREIVYAQGYSEAPVNHEFLCVKGRFGYNFAASPDRLTKPLIRRDYAEKHGITGETSPLSERFIETSWETALDLAAGGLAEIARTHGPDSLAGLASARCTNEDNYLFQKFMRAGLGTNNVDHCARLCHSSTVTGLNIAFGSGAMTNSIRELRDADCIFITGSNTAESHPVISYEVIRALKRGAHLIVVDPRRIPLAEHATLFLQPAPGTDQYVFLAMMHVIVRENWAHQDFIAARTEGFEAFAATLAPYTPEAAALQSGVSAPLIEQAARIYALGERVRGASIHGDMRGHASILYAMGITQRRNGTELVLTLANLAMLCGQIGKPSTGVNPLRGQSNVQGACDVGGLPNVLPGYQPVTDSAKRQAVAAVWEMNELPPHNGLTVVEMTNAAVAGHLRGMYIMGENPMLSDPNLHHVEAGLSALDLLIVQDIFITETAQLAHIVLPAAASLEKDGTFTNTERRVQCIHPVLNAPGEARFDWHIVRDLAERTDSRLGRTRREGYWQYPHSAAITDEIAAATPIYRGITSARIGETGLTWPCPAIDHPGTPILHTKQFTRGLGKFSAVQAQTAAEPPNTEYPFALSTGRSLYHYHTGTMTRRSSSLNWVEPGGYAAINPDDARHAGLKDGDRVKVKSLRGEIDAVARVEATVLPGTVFMAFHWAESAANVLTQDHTLDPSAKIPEYKVCAVKLEKA